jgi:AraC-like DNA-binding protein
MELNANSWGFAWSKKNRATYRFTRARAPASGVLRSRGTHGRRACSGKLWSRRADLQDGAVSNNRQFRRFKGGRRRRATVGRPGEKSLLTLLSRQVIRRFARLSSGGPTAIPLSLIGRRGCEDPPPNPGHPECLEYASTGYCRESWQLHLAEVRARPEAHWHRCDYDRLCALIPVVHDGRHLAVIKLVCPATTSEAEFERYVELLDLLVRDFASSEADFLARMPDVAPAAFGLNTPGARPGNRPKQGYGHPQVARTLQYVEQQLANPKLSVVGIARQIGVHPNYLSHLFAEQTGERLIRLIALRRIERAKGLLASTPASINRVARAVGFANPNWFSYVFRALTGLTASGYRKQSHGAARETSDR